MKHSKMFKMLLTGVAVVALASTTFAALSVTNSFESYADGDDIGTNTASGWDAEADVAMATTNDNPTGYHSGYPVITTHDVTMAFNDTVSNSLAGVAQEDVYVDFLVDPTFWTEDTTPDVPANSQLAMYFDTNGYANVYHGYFDTVSAETTNLWTLIDSVDAISTGDWVRVTYKMQYLGDVSNGNTFFNLYINGSLVTNKFAYPDMWPEEFPTTTNGIYFLNADSLGGVGGDKINSFTAKGSGNLDDFVVTSGGITPFVPPVSTQWTVTTTAGAGGSITAGGLVNDGASFSATVTASNYYLIATITTNAVGISITNTAVQVVDIDAVYNDITVAATFTLGSVPSSNNVDVASSWLLHYGFVLSEAMANAHWEAYLADIDPTTTNKFEIISAEVVDGTNVIKWISEGQTTNLPAFMVLGSDDLVLWSNTNYVPRPSTFKTNVFMDDTKSYYKLNATD